ncbi:MAG: hypothetical protein EZS28_043970, partial [Streblomastix strix]
IVTIGNFGGVQDNDRYNAGTAGGSSIQNSGTVDEIYSAFISDPSFGSTVGITVEEFPGQFYMDGTFLSYVDTEFHGITEDSKDKLSEFNIFDADFHINYVENYRDQNDWELQDYADLYARVINEVDQALNGVESSTQLKMKKSFDQLGCFFGEVEINGWLSQTEYVKLLRIETQMEHEVLDNLLGQQKDASSQTADLDIVVNGNNV